MLAPAGHGKTALALQFLCSACDAGAKVGFHSIEMSRTDLTDRLDRTLAGSEIALEVVRGKGTAITHKSLVVGTSQRPTFHPPSSTEPKSFPPGEVKVSETSKTP